MAKDKGESNVQFGSQNEQEVGDPDPVTHDDHEVSAQNAADEAGDGGALGGGALFGLGEDVGAVDEAVATDDPRVESRDIVHSAKTAEMAKRAGTARPTGDEVRKLKAAVPTAPAAGEMLDLVAYEEYTAEVAAQNAEAARAALKLTGDQRAQRVQELQRVSVEAYEG